MATAAEWMRRTPAREQSYRCVTIAIHDDEIAQLIHRGLLEQRRAYDEASIGRPVHRLFQRALKLTRSASLAVISPS
jgi:hypothetical protein